MRNFSIKNHLLYENDKQVQFIESPNVSEGSIVPLYVIEHYTADIKKGQAVSWLKNKDAKASAHIVIEADGTITQMVKFNKKAWHAGESKWKDLVGLNSFSIGIEIVNAGRLTEKGGKYFALKTEIPSEQVIKATHKNEKSPSYWQKYTEAQIQAAKDLTKLLMSYYNLRDVLGHDDIAPGRKSDPGPAFPMNEFKALYVSKLMYKTSTNVNLRTEGSVNGKIIEVIPANRAVNEIYKENGWSKVEINNKVGWINSNYLSRL